MVDNDLEFVHAVAGAGRADDVLFDHHAAHVVGAVGETELPTLPPCVTHDACRLSKLSRTMRASASVRR
jgi:hypothetical protein